MKRYSANVVTNVRLFRDSVIRSNDGLEYHTYNTFTRRHGRKLCKITVKRAPRYTDEIRPGGV